FVWQAGVAVGLTLPVVLAIGLNRYTFVRGLIGAGLVVVFGPVLGWVAGIVIAALLLGSIASGGQSSTDYGRIGDVLYLFGMGAAAGLAFAVSEAVYKPAWLKSRGGHTEGRTWTLKGPVSRIGSMEGVEVFIPP